MTYRMPAEWDLHERTLIAWPCREELWSGGIDQAKREHAAVADAVAAFEPVTMVANPGDGTEASAMCDSRVEVVELPIDDSWLRDCGPLIVRDEAGKRYGADFSFNAWGEKYHPYDKDDRVSAEILKLLQIERVDVPFVMEGGAISVDGEGTAIITRQCLLNPNRNGAVTEGEVEAVLRQYLGVEKVIWLELGLVEDLDTDGHIDLIAAFIGPGQILLQVVEDPRNPNYENCLQNLAILEGETDAQGRPIEVIPFSPLAYIVIGGELIAASYLNFYFCNGGVVVPLAGDDQDAIALAAITELFPEREVVGVPVPTVAFGGGGVHCITQQIPLAL